MKKQLVTAALLSMFMISCGGDNAEADVVSEAEQAELKKEILTTDSIASEMEHLKEDIESATEELDNLLEDL